jgi:hypothetical protein
MDVALTGNEIGANMMMLGYAWQKGFVPIGRLAIAQAIELNGVAIAGNIAAFDWGRMLAHDPAAVRSVAPPVTTLQRIERDLIGIIYADLDLVEGLASEETEPLLHELMALQQGIRGFGPVKQTAICEKKTRRKDIRASLGRSDAARATA